MQYWRKYIKNAADVSRYLSNTYFNIVGFYCGTTEVVPGVAKTEQKMQVCVKQW
jgi:hypothetical protein